VEAAGLLFRRRASACEPPPPGPRPVAVLARMGDDGAQLGH
jgi:hypothetical protein